MTPEAAAPEVFGVPTLALILTLTGTTVVLALALEQLFNFWGLVSRARDLGGEVGKVLYHGDIPAARTVCERSRSPVADIFIAALNKVNRPGESLRKAAERERQRFSLRMKRRLWLVGTVGALAPFIGLFGTVLGIIRSFRDIAASGAGGFAVVAQEVRSLAQRSGDAADNIKTLIEASNEQVQEGVSKVQQTGDYLVKIVESTETVASIVEKISVSASEQSQGVKEIASSITNLDSATQQNAALVEESAAAAEALRQQAVGLTSALAFFEGDAQDLSALRSPDNVVCFQADR